MYAPNYFMILIFEYQQLDGLKHFAFLEVLL